MRPYLIRPFFVVLLLSLGWLGCQEGPGFRFENGQACLKADIESEYVCLPAQGQLITLRRDAQGKVTMEARSGGAGLSLESLHSEGRVVRIDAEQTKMRIRTSTLFLKDSLSANPSLAAGLSIPFPNNSAIYFAGEDGSSNKSAAQAGKKTAVMACCQDACSSPVDLHERMQSGELSMQDSMPFFVEGSCLISLGGGTGIMVIETNIIDPSSYPSLVRLDNRLGSYLAVQPGPVSISNPRWLADLSRYQLDPNPLPDPDHRKKSATERGSTSSDDNCTDFTNEPEMIMQTVRNKEWKPIFRFPVAGTIFQTCQGVIQISSEGQERVPCEIVPGECWLMAVRGQEGGQDQITFYARADCYNPDILTSCPAGSPITYIQ